MKNNCCTSPTETHCKVTVTVDVARIVRYSCGTGILIVAIIFGAKCIIKLLDVIADKR